jgi:hypothetical protein
MWQCPPVGLPADTPPPPLPLPYPSNRSSSGLSGQLQGWIRGAIAAAAVGAPAVTNAAGGAGGGRSVSAAGSAVPGGSSSGSGSSGDAGGGVSCLATGSSWGEVVQVGGCCQPHATIHVTRSTHPHYVSVHCLQTPLRHALQLSATVNCCMPRSLASGCTLIICNHADVLCAAWPGRKLAKRAPLPRPPACPTHHLLN